MENRVKKTSWVDIYKKIGIYVILVAVFLFFSIVTPQFRTPANIINIIRQVSMFGIVVIGVTIVMLGGGMDLSVGGQMAVDGMIAGLLMVNLHVPFGLAIVIVLAVGVLFGFINGIVTITFNIPPIIVTLGTMLVLNGVAYIVTGGLPVNGMPEGFKVLGQGYIGVVPVPVIILIVFVIFGWIVVNKTYLGRQIYAVGGGKEASRLAGINIKKLQVGMYCFAGFAAATAALILTSRTNSSQPSAGADYPFDCMTAACLGGISMMGGEGKISGAIVGVIIIGILNNGLVLLGVNTHFQSVVKGLVLLVAVGIDAYQGKNK